MVRIATSETLPGSLGNRQEHLMKGLVNFAEFKQVNDARVVTNNAMIALLAGSRLASHTLQLTSGSDQLLPTIFPSVANIDRFNLVTERAKALLDDADSHVAAVSVPYALSVHEDFVMVVIDMLRARGSLAEVPGKRKLGPATMHETVFKATGYVAPADSLEVFHILREMRNSQIHEGGRANVRLVRSIAHASVEASALWTKITGQSVSDVVSNGRVEFVLEHMFLVFAIAKALAREINFALQAHWTSDEWAMLLVRDYSAITTNTRNSSSWRRSLIGYARLEYGALSLAEASIEAAARERGEWTAHAWR